MGQDDGGLRPELARLRAQRLAELDAAAEARLAAERQTILDRRDQVSDAWTELLQREPWHWFLTLTFDPKAERTRAGIHPEKANKAYRLLISSINRELWGPKWAKRPGAQGGLVWAYGEEFHKNGRVHYHALAAAPTADLNEIARRLSWMDWWHDHFGIARIERPRSQQDVAGYVSKYVVKQGAVTLSENFGRVRPPSLF